MSLFAQQLYQKNAVFFSSPVSQIAGILDKIAGLFLRTKQAIEKDDIAARFEATEKASKLILGLSSLWNKQAVDDQSLELIEFMNEFETLLTLMLLDINQNNDATLCQKAYDNTKAVALLWKQKA